MNSAAAAYLTEFPVFFAGSGAVSREIWPFPVFFEGKSLKARSLVSSAWSFVPDEQALMFPPHFAPDPVQALQNSQSAVDLNGSINPIRILLAHRLCQYKGVEEAGYHLQLPGHTHAGQFFPWQILVALTQKYYKGLNRRGKLWIYTNRRTRFWGPPLRFGVPSEVTLLRFRKALV